MLRRPAHYLRCSLAVLMAATLLTLHSSPVEAFTSEGQLWVGAGAANLQHAAPSGFGWWGPAATGGATFLISDFWRLTVDAKFSHHFSTVDDDSPEQSLGPHSIISSAIGIRYAFDVAKYVPYIELSGVFHPDGPPSSASPQGESLSARANLGFEYRKNRQMSLGGAIGLYAPMSQPSDFPHYSAVHLHIAYHFRRF